MTAASLRFPRVVATVSRASDLRLLRDSGAGFEGLLEYRLDQLGCSPGEVIAAIQATPNHPALVTARHPDEGGAAGWDSRERAERLRQMLDRAAAIDVELRSTGEDAMEEVLAEARAREILRVCSFHDFSGCPPREELGDVVERMVQAGAEVAKIAVTVGDFSDIVMLRDLVLECRERNRPIAAMGMGALGKLSRLILAEAGSCLNYGYLTTPNAPGQWPAAQLAECIGALVES